MKINVTSSILGVVVVLLGLAAGPAHAQRSSTAFALAHVENPLESNPYTCITEDNGAVFDNCTYSVSLTFGLTVDSPGLKAINLTNFWQGSAAEETFGCVPYYYTGAGTFSSQGQEILFTGPGQTKSTSVDLAAGENIQVICWNVPVQGGLAKISWTP